MILGNLSFFSRAPLTMASMMLGWSEPKFTKQWVTPASHSASKKANDVVYIFGLILESRRDWPATASCLLFFDTTRVFPGTDGRRKMPNTSVACPVVTGSGLIVKAPLQFG